MVQPFQSYLTLYIGVVELENNDGKLFKEGRLFIKNFTGQQEEVKLVTLEYLDEVRVVKIPNCVKILNQALERGNQQCVVKLCSLDFWLANLQNLCAKCAGPKITKRKGHWTRLNNGIDVLSPSLMGHQS